MASKGTHSAELYGLIHTLVTNYHHTPEARDALNKEWETLERIPAWGVKAVHSKAQVKAEAYKNGLPVHFAQLMALCFLKNVELENSLRTYTGRVVLRGTKSRKSVASNQCSLNNGLRHRIWWQQSPLMALPGCLARMA